MAVLVFGCSDVTLEPKPKFVWARFDLEVIPTPNDALRDVASGRLQIPLTDARFSAAEQELYAFFSTLDGWPASTPASVEFSGPISAASVNAESLQVWAFGPQPRRIEGLTLRLSSDGMRVGIDAPSSGWERGTRYVVLLRGGATGVEDTAGQAVECDLAFYFLRQRSTLSTPELRSLFPGMDDAARAANAQRLETLRIALAPAFEFFEQRGVPRAEVAALWSFTISSASELAIDAATQRIPLPSQLLVDPSTGRIDVPDDAQDSPAQRDAKQALRAYDGFSLSGSLLFEFGAPMDPTSLTPQSVQLIRLDTGTFAPVDADVRLMNDGIHVVVTPKLPLAADRSSYAVIVRRGVRDARGREAVAMPAGFLMMARSPLVQDGRSTVSGVPLEAATRLEISRAMLVPLLDAVGRERLIGAWPFVTMSVTGPMRDVATAAERLGVPVDPANVQKRDWTDALLEFPLAITSFGEVGAVHYGTIKSPQFLDPVSRAFRADGTHTVADLPFIMTVPDPPPSGPAPVVIFAHAVGAERRFLLAIGDALAAQGMVGIAIDLPYHGMRSACTQSSPSLAVDPLTGGVVSLAACEDGDRCDPQGRCVDASGQPTALARWPVLDMPVASGEAFFELDRIAATRDHVRQAVVDLAALERSLRKGNWRPVLGQPIDTSRIFFAGESLGAIIGASWLGVADTIPRAALNVPGADLVEMMRGSALLKQEFDRYLANEGVAKDSVDEELTLNVARWFVDSVDPQSFVTGTAKRTLLVQMATADSIIPNWSTRLLADRLAARRIDYAADHLFLVLPLEDEFTRGGRDLATFLSTGTIAP